MKNNIPENVLQQMFAYMNQLQHKVNNNNNKSSSSGYTRANNLIFGEELPNYVQFEGNNVREVMVRDPMAGVKAIASQITLHFYGESRFVQFIAGMYNDLVNIRVSKGFKGVRGKNMKGLICAILYILVLYNERARLSIDKLVDAANNVMATSKVKVTSKMVNRYIIFVIENLSQYNNNNNNINNDIKHLNREIKRICVSLGYNFKETKRITQMVQSLPQDIVEEHMPRTLAAVCVYWYATNVQMPPDHSTNSSIINKIGITRHTLSKLLKKLKKVSIIIK